MGPLVVARGIFLIALNAVLVSALSVIIIYIYPLALEPSPPPSTPLLWVITEHQAGLPVLHNNLVVACKVLVAARGSNSLTRGGTQAPCIGSTDSAPGPPGKPQYIMLTEASEYSQVSVMNKHWFYMQENTPRNSSYS